MPIKVKSYTQVFLGFAAAVLVIATAYLVVFAGLPIQDAIYVSLNVLAGESPITADTSSTGAVASPAVALWLLMAVRLSGWLLVPVAFAALVMRRLDAIESARALRTQRREFAVETAAKEGGLDEAATREFLNQVRDEPAPRRGTAS